MFIILGGLCFHFEMARGFHDGWEGTFLEGCLASIEYAESNYVFSPLPFPLHALRGLDAGF